jgi:hypothetical protein
MKLDSARRRLVAAVALYLLWIGALVAMAVTSSERPPVKLVPSAPGGDAPTARTPAR